MLVWDRQQVLEDLVDNLQIMMKPLLTFGVKVGSAAYTDVCVLCPVLMLRLHSCLGLYSSKWLPHMHTLCELLYRFQTV